MIDKIFVDTNVLVYAYDAREREKHVRAIQIIDQFNRAGVGVISTQVLTEFFVTITRKLPDPLTPYEAYTHLGNYVQSWTILDLTALIVLEAARGVVDYQFSVWDAQIWAAAKLNQIEIVFSEDFNGGAMIEGVRFINPFAPDFRLEEWL
ncbi:MAG: PIN domain-containing protein [Caldilineaceae bacterium]